MFNDQYLVQEFLSEHPLLKVVLERFNIDQPTNSQEIRLLSRGNDKEISFLMEVYCMFERPNYFPDDYFGGYSLEMVINYLKQTHKYYLEKRLPGIEQSLRRLTSHCPDDSLIALLENFYNSYRDELVSHISIEEELLFPYIAELKELMRDLGMERSGFDFSISQFAQVHDHKLEQALFAICQTIEEKYPDVAGYMSYRMFRNQLELLHEDLRVHEQLENEVLLPRAAAIEQVVNAGTSKLD